MVSILFICLFTLLLPLGTTLQNGHRRAEKPHLPEPWLGEGEPQGTYPINGDAGIICSEDGIVQEFFNNTPPGNGIRLGHKITSIGTEPFTHERLRHAENSGSDYYVTVTCLDMMATREQLAERHNSDTDLLSESPTGWVKERDEGYPAYYQLHIPKTAGTSFTEDLKKLLSDAGAGLYAKEGCYHPMRKLLSPNDSLITMLRHPVAHVFSQYLMCAYSCWGQNNTRNDRSRFKTLDAWLDYFQEASSEDEKDAGLGCYHPLNMQTRALTCREQKNNAVHMNLRPIGNSIEAIQNMRDLFFVGIAEFYQESLCLFIAKAHNFMPKCCNCEDPENWNRFEMTHDGHKLPSHSMMDLSASQKAKILPLVADDLKLYEKGLQQFANEAKRIEQQFKVKVVCQDIQESH